jgi:hypothetical protein
MPAYASARDAGHNLVRHPGGREGLGLFTTAPEHEGVATLEPHHGGAGAPAVDEHRVDLVLGQINLTRRLARRDQLRADGHDLQQR